MLRAYLRQGVITGCRVAMSDECMACRGPTCDGGVCRLSGTAMSCALFGSGVPVEIRSYHRKDGTAL